MNYREELLATPNNTPLSYVGAALLGIVLSGMFNLVVGGQILMGVVLYAIYVTFVLFIDTLCKDDVKYACQFNELWITLDELAKRKMGK